MTELSPDIICIDGRFAIACFAYARIRITKSVKILFANYHANFGAKELIERFLKPSETDDYFALFVLEPIQADDKDEFRYFENLYYKSIYFLHNC